MNLPILFDILLANFFLSNITQPYVRQAQFVVCKYSNAILEAYI